MASDAGIVGGVLVVPLDHPAADVFVRALKKARVAARDNGITFDDRLTVLLHQLAALSVGASTVPAAVPRLGAGGSAASGLTLLSSVEISGTSEVVVGMCTSDVAALTGVTDRAVRKAAQAGRLAGRRTDLGWQFSAGAVKAWRDKRSTDNEPEK